MHFAPRAWPALRWILSEIIRERCVAEATELGRTRSERSEALLFQLRDFLL